MSGKKQTLAWKINIDAISDQLHRIASFDVKSIDLNDEGLDLKYEGDTFLIKGGSSSFVKGSHMDVISRHFPNYMLTTVNLLLHMLFVFSPSALSIATRTNTIEHIILET